MASQCDWKRISTAGTMEKRGNMGQQQVTGTFEVQLIPQKANGAQDEAAGLIRMAMDKQFEGPLEGTSQGMMLSVLDREKGSGGYVALERVTGILEGRRGSFVLQHNATIDRGAPEMDVAVVPDSGTEELIGLAGTMTIRIEGGQHYYDFAYSLNGSR